VSRAVAVVRVEVVEAEARAVASGGSTPHSQSSESIRTLLPLVANGRCTSFRKFAVEEAPVPREAAGGLEQEAAVAAGEGRVAEASELVAQAEAAVVLPCSSGCLGTREGHCRTPRASPASPACSRHPPRRRSQGTTLADRCTCTSIQRRRSVAQAGAAAVAAVVRVVVVPAVVVAAMVRVVVVAAAVGMAAAVMVVKEGERAVASGGSIPHSQSSG